MEWTAHSPVNQSINTFRLCFASVQPPLLRKKILRGGWRVFTGCAFCDLAPLSQPIRSGTIRLLSTADQKKRGIWGPECCLVELRISYVVIQSSQTESTKPQLIICFINQNRGKLVGFLQGSVSFTPEITNTY